MPDRYDDEAERLLGGGDAADAEAERLLSAPATPALRPIDHEVADQLEGGRYAKPGIGWMDRDNARAELSGSSNPDAWTGEIRTNSPTDQQVEDLAYNNRHRDRGAEYEDGVRERYMALRLRGEDSKQAAGQGGKVPLEIERERVPLEVMERRLKAEESARRASQMGLAAAVALSPMMGMNDLVEGVSGWISGRRPEPQPLAAEVDEVVGRSGLGTKIAAGIGRAAGQMALTAPVAGGLGGGAGAWTAAGALGAAAQAPEGQRLQAATESTVSMALTLGGTRLLQRFLPGPALLRIPVAGATAGTGVEVVIDVATGRQVSAEEFAEKAARNTVFSLNDIPAVYRAEVYQNLRRGVESRRADRAYTAAEQRAGMADPARPEAEAYREAMAEALDRLFLSRGIEDDAARHEMVRRALASQPEAFTYGQGDKIAAPTETDPLMGTRTRAPEGTVPPNEFPAPTQRASLRTNYGPAAEPAQPDVLGVTPGADPLPVDPRSPGARGVRGVSMPTDYAAEPSAPMRDPLGFRPGEAPLGPGVYGTENVSPVVDYAPSVAADPLLPEPAPSGRGMATNPKRRGKGMARPKPMSQAEAGEVKADYLARGGDPTHVMSPERVAAVERGEPLPPPEVRPDGSIAAGYDPQAREKGLIEPGALPAVDAAEAQGVRVVSSGTDPATGEGYAVGRAPSGEVVEVWAPAPDVAARQLPEKSPLADTPAPADDPDLPAYLRNVTPAPRLKPEPKGGMGRGRMADPERGAVEVPEFVGKAAEAVGREAGGLGRAVKAGYLATQRVFGAVANKVRQRGKTGAAIADRIPEAVVATEDFHAASARERNRALSATQGQAGFGDKAKASRDAQALAPQGDGSSLRPAWVDMIEGDAQPGTPAMAEIVASTRDWLKKMHDVWVGRPGGRETQGINGKWSPAQPWQGEVRVVPFMAHPNLRRVFREGPGGKDWGRLREGAINDNPNIPPEKIDADLLRRSQLAQSEMREASEFDTAGEHRRGIKMPWAVPDGKGGVLQLGEINPHRYINRYARARAGAEGVDTVWGQGSKSTLDDLRKSFVAENPTHADDFVKVFRSLHGMSPEAMETQAGTPAGTLRRRWGHVLRVWRGSKRVTAAITDVSSWLFGNDAQGTGLKNKVLGNFVAAQDFLSRVLGRGHTEAVNILIDEGIKTQNAPDWTPNPEAGPIGRGIDYTGKVMQEGFARPFEEGQETSTAAAGTLRLGEMRGSERDVIDLKTFAGVDDATARGFFDLTLPAEKMQEVQSRFLRGMTKKGLATNLSPVERSSYEQSTLIRSLITFPGWPAHNARFTLKRLGDAWSSYKQGLTGRDTQGNKLSGGERARRGIGGAAAAGKFLAYKAAEGFISSIAFAALSPWTDMGKEIDKFMEDPEGYLAERAFWSALGGPWAGVLSGAFSDGPGNPLEKSARAVVRSTAPSQMVEAVTKPGGVKRAVPAINLFTDDDSGGSSGGGSSRELGRGGSR